MLPILASLGVGARSSTVPALRRFSGRRVAAKRDTFVPATHIGQPSAFVRPLSAACCTGFSGPRQFDAVTPRRSHERGTDIPQRRFYAAQKKSNASQPLANERLVSFLTQGKTSADDVGVRVVVDEGPEAPATVFVGSLADAIRISVDRSTDLIGVSLGTDPPVIKAASLNRMMHQKELSAKKNAGKSSKNKRKSFRFKTGIDDNDFDRKVNDMTRFLQKGSECEFTVVGKARVLRKNIDAGAELAERIQTILVDVGKLKSKPQRNESGSFIKVVLEPKKTA